MSKLIWYVTIGVMFSPVPVIVSEKTRPEWHKEFMDDFKRYGKWYLIGYIPAAALIWPIMVYATVRDAIDYIKRGS